MEKISIIIPVYNTENFISKCVNSFIEQTYSNIEIILVDDGSTDESSKICDEFHNKDSRVVVIHKENGGPSDARNIGLENASGDLITFFDSDDYVDNNYIEYLYNILSKYNTQISACAYNIADENNSILFTIQGKKNEECISKTEFIRRMLVEDGITVSPCFKLFRSSLLKNVRFPKGKLFEDNGTTYKIIDNCKTDISYGNKAYCYYVMRSNSQMRSNFNIKKMDMIELTDEMCDYLSIYYPTLKDSILRRRIYSRFNILRQLDYYDKTTTEIRINVTNYILKNFKFILTNNSVPHRDKIAAVLLFIDSRLFFKAWDLYRKVKYER